MIDDKRLAEIEGREKAATPGPWVYMDVEGVYGGQVLSVAGDAHCTPVADTPHLDDRPHDMAFIAESRSDVPDLCASLREAWHLIWVMSRDQDAYLRGKEDGRRECVEALGELAALMKRESRLFGGQWRIQRATIQAAADLLHKGHDLPPPLPPDAIVAENARLRKQVQDLLNRTPQKID